MSTVSQAISAFGVIFRIGDGDSPESFAKVAEVKNIAGPTIAVDALETTTHNTPSPVRRYIPGLMNFGEITLSLNYNPGTPTHSATQGGLAQMAGNRLVRNVQIVFPDDRNTTWQGPAFVTKFDISADPAQLLMASCGLKCAGVFTLT